MIVFNSLSEKYRHLGWSVAAIKGDDSFTIIDMARTGLKAPFKTPTFRLNFFVFSFIKDGSGTYTVDDITNQFQPHTFFFTNPSHYRSVECSYLNEGYFMTFSEAFLKEYVEPNVFDEFPFFLTGITPPVNFGPETYEAFEQIYLLILKEYNLTSEFRYRIIGSLLNVLFVKLKEYYATGAKQLFKNTRSGETVKQFKLALEKHYRELAGGRTRKVNRLKDYADALHLHPNYLSTFIKQNTGKSIKVWIAEKTVSEAKSLLQNSSLSINEIGYRLGFTNPSHFCNYLKRYIKVGPRVYRSMNGANSVLKTGASKKTKQL